MNKAVFLFLFFLLFATFPSTVQAQTGTQALKDLDKTFTAFQYREVLKKGRFYLGEPYIQKKDSLAIYTYMLNAAYAIQDTSQARQFILTILKINPQYNMNPATTSPKIIELFDSVKAQHPAFPKETSTVKKPAILDTVFVHTGLSPGTTIATLILPGSGHWFRGYSKEGYIRGGISLALLTSTIYSVIHTRQLEIDYLKETRATEMNDRYNTYNTNYKWRNALFAAYIGWSIYNLFDLSEKIPALSIDAHSKSLSAHIRIPLN